VPWTEGAEHGHVVVRSSALVVEGKGATTDDVLPIEES